MPSCCMFVMSLSISTRRLAELSAGSRIEIKRAIMKMTTKSSMSVKHLRTEFGEDEDEDWMTGYFKMNVFEIRAEKNSFYYVMLGGGRDKLNCPIWTASIILNAGP